MTRAALIGCVCALTPQTVAAQAGKASVGPDPLNTTYRIQGEPVELRNGRFEKAAAPGSASRRIVQVVGEPSSGDLDGDGRSDHALLLVDDAGGSGTFYYLVAALALADGYLGTNAVLIGDRVHVSGISVRDGAVIVRYLARAPGQAMAVSPSVPIAARFTVSGAVLARQAERSATVLQGWVVVGHEVRTFSPCSRGDELWLLGEAPVLKTIAQAYARSATGKRPHLPVLMELTGRIEGRQQEGFGSRYQGTFVATGLVEARPGALCLGDRLALSSPAPGDVVRSPMLVEGRAATTWFGDGLISLTLLDSSGNALAHGHAVATHHRSEDGFIGFRGTLEFPRKGNAGATLVIQENNPDRDPAARQASRVPVVIR